MTVDPEDRMIVAGSRMLRNHRVVFAGVGAPLQASVLAQQIHAPDALGTVGRKRVRRTRAVEHEVSHDAGVAQPVIEQFLARKYRGKNLAELLAEEKHLASAYRRLRTAGFGAGNSIRVLKRYAAQADLLEE